MIKQTFTRDDLASHVSQVGMGVVSTVSVLGHPEAAFMELVATAEGEIVFVTKLDARKAVNLRADPRIAVVVGWEKGITVQVEGVAELPTGDGRAELARLFEERFRGASARAEDFALFRVRPLWARYYDTNPESYCEIETTWTTPEAS
ncbi:MAG TPA: pyridoxamine 5'-phosphate oxidase family protein [Propionibacteriaceae bacterium]|nr:pyridoxamine 5'-phosphate oxidase family protein [Propionibacteriaceae bacterium]